MDPWQVAAEKRSRIQPEAGQNFAASHPVRSGGQWLVPALTPDEPVDCLIEHPPNDVFADPIAAVSVQLVAEVVAGTAGGHVSGEFGGGLDVIVLIDPRLTALPDHQAK